jgi:hypothetical protein
VQLGRDPTPVAIAQRGTVFTKHPRPILTLNIYTHSPQCAIQEIKCQQGALSTFLGFAFMPVLSPCYHESPNTYIIPTYLTIITFLGFAFMPVLSPCYHESPNTYIIPTYLTII